MATQKYPLLKAIEHNRWMSISGSLIKIMWVIFSDGSYEIVSTRTPSILDEIIADEKNLKWEERPKELEEKATGIMTDEALSKLIDAIACEPWRDPSTRIDAVDGAVWEIESYRSDGSIDKTSGEVDYIYGQKTLETIVSLLPWDMSVYGGHLSFGDQV